ncbi:MAG: hypothetical protein ACXAD7_02070 [Candidatus Kariarchaeaceae archaeon]
MISNAIVCQNCVQEVSSDRIFCPNCGNNLQLPDKISSIAEISYKKEIEEDFLEQYLVLEKKIDEFEELEFELQKQKDHYKTLLHEYESAVNAHNMWKTRTEAEWKDVENLKKRSWETIKARIKGSHEQLFQKEELEYFEALNQLEASKKDKEELRKKLDIAEKQFDEISAILKNKQVLQHDLLEVIYKACEGVRDVVEDAIEMELSRLSEKIEPFLLQKSKLQVALSHLLQAAEIFRHTRLQYDEIKEQEGIVGSGLVSDTITSSKMAEIRDSMQLASHGLNQAYSLLTDLQSEKMFDMLQGGEFWNTFMRNLLKDVQNFRTKKSKEFIVKTIVDTNKVVAWIGSRINSLDLEINQIYTDIAEKREDLTQERTRIIKESLARK